MSDASPDARDALQALLARAHCPDDADDPFVMDGERLAPERVIDILRPVMTAARLARIETVVGRRTRTVVPVIEGLANVGNVSAVLRSAEALGYQDVHVIRGANDRFKHSERTSKGAEKWLDLYRWPDPATCVEYLHARGYRVLAMDLAPEAVPITEVDFTAPTALVFGNEHGGVSADLRTAADEACIVPLAGFTESFNVSVAAAVALYHAQQDRRARQGHHADLTDDAQTRLVARFCLRSVRNAEAILRRALDT